MAETANTLQTEPTWRTHTLSSAIHELVNQAFDTDLIVSVIDVISNILHQFGCMHIVFNVNPQKERKMECNKWWMKLVEASDYSISSNPSLSSNAPKILDAAGNLTKTMA